MSSLIAGVRFAPSPTGTFHIGNLRTAWVSHRLAEVLGLPWVVRFEDIDRPRVLPGAMENQLSDLRQLGLEPRQVLVQSEAFERHWTSFVAAIRSRQVYACACSRKEVRAALDQAASAPHSRMPSYSGVCRHRAGPPASVAETLAWRFRMPDESGGDDFIVARTAPGLDPDGLPDRESFAPAYHWACAVDDFDARHPLIVRAADLESALEPQQSIQRWLSGEGSPFLPSVFHTALVVQDDGHRLEKRTAGVTLAELFGAGIDSRRVLDSFERSFETSNAPSIELMHLNRGVIRGGAGRAFFEAQKEIRFSQLGLKR